MPPKKELKPELIEIFKIWIMGGIPETAAGAEALGPLPGCTTQVYPAPTIETPTNVTP